MLLSGAARLARFLPEAPPGLPVPTPGAGSEGERRLLFAAVNRFLANLAPNGSALLVDDLQWAGQDALDLLGTISREAERHNVRIVGAYRSTELPATSPLALLRAELVSAGLAAEVPVEPLDAADAAALLDVLLTEPVDAETRRDVLARGAGVPFYLKSYAGGVTLGSISTAVPWTAAQSVQQRIEAVPQPGRDVLGAVAVVGRFAPVWLLRSVMGWPDATLISALESATAAGLLAESEVGDYTFTHDVIRDVVEDTLSAARRRVLHARVAECLCAQSPGAVERDAARIARHLELAGETDRAAAYALQAGVHAAERLAHADGAAHFELAARLAAGSDAGVEAEALYRLGVIRVIQGKLIEAAAALQQAADLRRQRHQLEEEALAVAELGFARFYLGDCDSVLPRARRLIASLEPAGPSRGLCSLYLLLTILLYGADPHSGLDAAERASAAARDLQVGDLWVQAEIRRGLALYGMRRFTEGADVLEAALPLAEDLGDLTRLAEGAAFAAMARQATGDLERAVSLSAWAASASEQLASPGHLAYSLGYGADTLIVLGRWKEARAALEHAVQLNHSGHTPAFAATYHLYLAEIAYLEGRVADAEQSIAATLALRDGSDQQRIDRSIAWMRANYALRTGHPGQALATIAPYRADVEAHPGVDPASIPLIIEILAAAGHPDEARALLEVADPIAQAHEDAVIRVQLLAVRAVLTNTGCAAALEAARALPFPLLAGRVLLEWGRHTGDVERIAEAIDIFETLGAVPDAARAATLSTMTNRAAG